MKNRKPFLPLYFCLLILSLLTACNLDEATNPSETHTKQEENISLVLGNSITFDASKKSEAHNNAATFHWQVKQVPQGSAITTLVDTDSQTPKFTPDIEGTYKVSLIVDDDNEQTETIFIIAVDKAVPQSTSGENTSVLTGSTVTLSGAGQFDDASSFNWQIKSVPANSNITNDTLFDRHTANPSFTPDVPGQYRFLLSVSNQTNIQIVSETKITVLENNIPPVAIADENKTVVINTTVTLSAEQSSDADDDPLSYSWVLTSKPATSTVFIEAATSQTLTFIPDAVGIFEFTLSVSDGTDSDSTTVLITANAPIDNTNNPPVANAGLDQDVLVNEQVFLDASESTDMDGDSLNYLWMIISKPENSSATLSSSTSVTTSFTSDIAGSYTISLVVNDGLINSNNSAIATVTATTPNNSPVADVGLNQFVRINDIVNLDGSASFDPDGDQIAYAWTFTTAPTGSSAVLQNVTTATPQFTPNVAGEYSISLEVSDGKMSSQVNTLVTAEDRQEGTSNEPKLLSYATAGRFPYKAELQNVAGYYQVTGLDNNIDYHIFLSNLTDNVDLEIYADSVFNNLICESRNNFMRHENCIAKLANSNEVLYINIDNLLATDKANFTLNIVPAINEGTEQTPVILELDKPYLGTIHDDVSYYMIKDIDPSKNYVVSLKDKTNALELWVAYDTNPDACHLVTTPEKNYLCNVQGYTGGTLRIKVLHGANNALAGKSFELLVTEGQAINSEGTLDSPVLLTHDGSDLEHSNGRVDTNTSYYQISNLTIGREYNVQLNDMSDNVYLEILDESGEKISAQNFPTQFSFTANSSMINVHVQGDETKMGANFTLMVQETSSQLVSQGSVDNPLILTFDNMQDSLLHPGSVLSTADSFYQITNLPTDLELIFALSGHNQNIDLYLYSDQDFSSVECESILFQHNQEYCSLVPKSDVMFVKVDSSHALGGTAFDLTVAPALFESEGSQALPLDLEGSVVLDTGHNGSVDVRNSFYKINNLKIGTAYEVRLEQPSADIDLFVYTSSFDDSNLVCSSENWEDTAIETCIATSADTSIRVKVSGEWSGGGASFVLTAIEQ